MFNALKYEFSSPVYSFVYFALISHDFNSNIFILDNTVNTVPLQFL